jgi:hypothetical protein
MGSCGHDVSVMACCQQSPECPPVRSTQAGLKNNDFDDYFDFFDEINEHISPIRDVLKAHLSIK